MYYSNHQRNFHRWQIDVRLPRFMWKKRLVFQCRTIDLLGLSRLFSLNGLSDIKGGGCCWLEIFDCVGGGIRVNILGGSGGP